MVSRSQQSVISIGYSAVTLGGQPLGILVPDGCGIAGRQFSRASSGVTEKVCVSVRPLLEGAGRAAGDLVHGGGDGRVVELVLGQGSAAGSPKDAK
jgi:hypothetical protein